MTRMSISPQCHGSGILELLKLFITEVRQGDVLNEAYSSILKVFEAMA
jgi:hypothetical protein